jgi:WXG100 family type VII secretion target
MQGRMKISLTTLVELTSELESITTDMEQKLTRLDKVVKSLEDKWDGETKGAFSGDYQNWRRTSSDLHIALKSLHASAKTAHSNYVAAKAANLSMWQA